MGLFFETVGHYKSSFYETARNLLKSRDNQRVRAISLRDQLEAERKANEQLRAENQQLAQQIQSIQRHNQELRRKVEQLQTQPVVLPPDPPLPQHQFGARMISICIQLAKTVGIRASVKVLKLIFDWLSIKANIPNWTTVRTWLCRMLSSITVSGPVSCPRIWLR